MARGHYLIDVKDLNALTEYGAYFKSQEAAGNLPTVVGSHAMTDQAARIKRAPAVAGTPFLEARSFGNGAWVQSDALEQFAGEVINGIDALASTAYDVYNNYHGADLRAKAALEKLDSKLIHDELADPIRPIDQPKALYATHGWDQPKMTRDESKLRFTGTGDRDYYGSTDGSSDATVPGGTTQWRKGDEAPGAVFTRVVQVVSAEQPGLLIGLAERWRAVGTNLHDVAGRIQHHTATLKKGWDGAAADVFAKRAAESVASIRYWATWSGSVSGQFAAVASALSGVQEQLAIAQANFNQLDSAVAAIRDGVAQAMVKEQVENVKRQYDDWAERYALNLGLFYFSNAPWTAPPQYPGLLNVRPVVPELGTSGKTDIGDGPTGGLPTGGLPTGGVPTGGSPKTGGPDNAAAVKKAQDALRKQEEEIRKQQAAAQKKFDEMVKKQQEELRKQQEALNKQQEQLNQTQTDLNQQNNAQQQQQQQQQLDDLQRQMQDSLNALPSPDNLGPLPQVPSTGSVVPSDGLGTLPAGLGGLGSIGGLGAVGGGGLGTGGAGGLGGATISTGLPSAGAVDLMGRTGTTVPTTGLGGAALSGRAATPSGQGPIPFVPPMGGAGMGAPGGGAALSGRRGRPVLPDETPKPVGKPRIVDPDGDGTTASRRARDNDRRATVAEPNKAPEVEPGQALGRTA
jgi:hypothetical protein